MAITRNQQKNEFDDRHDCVHVCVLVYRSGLSRNSFIQCFLPNIFKKKWKYILQCLVNTGGMY